MKKLFLVIIAALFVSGCALNPDNDLFTKKKECAALQTEIEQRLEKLSNETRELRLNRIFYSPKLNTCMYTSTNQMSFVAGGNATRETYTLYDAFTNEGVEQEFGCTPRDNCEKEAWEASRDFDKLVKEYE